MFYIFQKASLRSICKGVYSITLEIVYLSQPRTSVGKGRFDTLQDILVIPVSKDGQDEVILTVPSKDVGTSLKGQVTLNAPRTQSILRVHEAFEPEEGAVDELTLKK